jgi:hypothetical protein
VVGIQYSGDVELHQPLNCLPLRLQMTPICVFFRRSDFDFRVYDSYDSSAGKHGSLDVESTVPSSQLIDTAILVVNAVSSKLRATVDTPTPCSKNEVGSPNADFAPQ